MGDEDYDLVFDHQSFEAAPGILDSDPDSLGFPLGRARCGAPVGVILADPNVQPCVRVPFGFGSELSSARSIRTSL